MPIYNPKPDENPFISLNRDGTVTKDFPDGTRELLDPSVGVQVFGQQIVDLFNQFSKRDKDRPFVPLRYSQVIPCDNSKAVWQRMGIKGDNEATSGEKDR